jgi:MtaA/CmuA family methyltransferase
MTGKQRYLDMLQGKPVDFVPRVPILMQFAAEYIGSNYGAFASDHRVLAESNFRCAADFGMDQLSVISDPYRETSGFGGQVKYVRDGVPRCPHPPLEDSKDLAMLAQPDPLRSPRMLDRVQAVEDFARDGKGRYSILGWVEGPAAEAADIRGVQAFFMDLMDDEPFAEALMDRCLDVGIAFARAQLEAGADTIGIGDAIASQVSPDMYGRLIQPREKALVRAIQQAGGLVRLHICGNITQLLAGIADLGVNVLDVDHMVDMARVRRVLGAKVTLAGNLDPVSAVRFSQPQAIRLALQRVYEQVGNPYLVNAGCEIPAGTPPENVKALCEPLGWVS